MVTVSRERRAALEDLTGKLFLVAGGAWLALQAGDALASVAPVPTPDGVTGIVGFLLDTVPATVGLPLAFAAVLVVYPRLADRQPRLARASLALVVIAVDVFLVVTVWVLLSVVFSEMPLLVDVVPVFSVYVLGAWVLFFLGLVAFGAALVRTGGPLRLAGGAVLVLAATWNAPKVVDELTGGVPDGLYPVTLFAMGVSMLVIGYVLVFERESLDGTRSSTA